MEDLKRLGLFNAEEKIALVAILQAHGEDLESLYTAESGFCGLYDKIVDVKDTVQRLFDKHVYFANEEEMIERFKEEAQTAGTTWQQFVAGEEIHSVGNGYVWFQYC